MENFENKKVDVIIFDGAPDVTGVIDVDMYMQLELIIFALVIEAAKKLVSEEKIKEKFGKEE